MRSPSIEQVEDPFSARFHSGRSGRHPDGASPVEGLRMSQSYEHRPVMVDEVTTIFGEVPPGSVVDATVGGGGHARALLRAHPQLSVIGIDRDPAALEAAGAALAEFGDRVVLRRARFDDIARVVAGLGHETISGALFDLGVSSHQLDRPERGFSYREDSPLDMRMDPDGPVTAADVLNTYDEAELARLFAASGERRFARRIARSVVAGRPLASTGDLVEAVKRGVPAAARRTGGHPAKRVFQAVRIEVNGELDALGPAVDAAIGLLAPGGRVVTLAYHSGEDRLVKERFALAATGGCVCPPGLPCVCGAVPTGRLLNRGARKPSAAEIEANPRAEAARLRALEKLEVAT
ncbi:MAG: rRNA (cytosine1402-N4)-methyltransferase [Actinomycetota bacterium]|jgi:16S rRNA (cytosine1402-N4)-methyltransferase